MGAVGSLLRLQQITALLARHGLGHFLESRRASRRAGDELLDEGESRAADQRKLAERFRAVLEELGPTFIKFGQVLSTRPDLLPPGFAEALRGLQDDCPALPAAEIEAAVTQGLGQPLDRLFRRFDSTPIASASIAQVHRAVTLSGDEVAVKVQRPGVRDEMMRDLDLLALLAELVQQMTMESGLVTPRAIVEEFESAFLGEVDFAREARMMRRFAATCAEAGNRGYVVPKVYDELSSRTVLTMQLMTGRRLDALEPRHDKRAIAKNILAGAFEQVFVDGLFHADPHPGNVFVLDDNRLALIDFGCVGQVSYAMRETLLALSVAIGTRDAETVARLLYRVGIPDDRVALHKLRDACASLLDEYLRDSVALADVEATKLFADLLAVASRFRLRLPSEYALLARAGMTIEGILRQLDPKLEVAETAKPFLKRLLDEQLKVGEVQDAALKGLLRARSLASELPTMAAQILMDLEGGKLQIQVDGQKLEQIARSIDALGVTVFIGLVSSGLVTGALFLLAGVDWHIFGVPVIPAVALYLAGLALTLAMGRYLLAPRLSRFSGWRWLVRRLRR